MQRIVFLLQTKANRIEEYDPALRHVWPELLRGRENFGVTEYSIFRRARLFLFLRVPDLEKLKQQLAAGKVNHRWQRHMASLFRAVRGETSEGFALLEEIFLSARRPQPALRA